jgi:hypothetical protein
MDISIESIKTGLLSFFKRFHVLLFTLFVLGGLMAAVLLLNDIIAKSGTSTDYVPEAANTSFDQATIDKIKQLRSGSESGGDDLNLTDGRSNPFVE